MDFFTDLMGLILLIVCILIVLIFLKDYIRLGGKKTTVNKKQKMIVYEVHQNNKRRGGLRMINCLSNLEEMPAAAMMLWLFRREHRLMKRPVSAEHGFIFRKMLWAITWCIVQNCPVMVKRDSQKRKNWWLRTAIPGKQCTL